MTIVGDRWTFRLLGTNDHFHLSARLKRKSGQVNFTLSTDGRTGFVGTHDIDSNGKPLQILLCPSTNCHSRPQQRREAGLFEVMVGRQSSCQPLLLHDDERYAVGQRPFFVGPLRIKIESLGDQCCGSRRNRNGRILLWVFPEGWARPRDSIEVSALLTSTSTNSLTTTGCRAGG